MFFCLYILFLFTKCAIAAEHKNIVVPGSYKQSKLVCNVFNIGGTCNTEEVQAKSGTVGGSMFLKNGVITEWLKVGGSLHIDGLLHVSKYNVDGSTHANQIYAAKAIVNGSMDITEKAFFTKSLSVGGLLNCISMTNEGPTKVGGTINAKNSTFKDVAIKSTSRYLYGNNISVNNGTVINASNNSVVTYSRSLAWLLFIISGNL